MAMSGPVEQRSNLRVGLTTHAANSPQASRYGKRPSRMPARPCAVIGIQSIDGLGKHQIHLALAYKGEFRTSPDSLGLLTHLPQIIEQVRMGARKAIDTQQHLTSIQGADLQSEPLGLIQKIGIPDGTDERVLKRICPV